MQSVRAVKHHLGNVGGILKAGTQCTNLVVYVPLRKWTINHTCLHYTVHTLHGVNVQTERRTKIA